MFPFLSQDIQDELAQLAGRYGQPVVEVADLGVPQLFDPLNRNDRYGEVCMVVRRLNGRLLTMKKTFYPTGAFRLLTGGIHYGEPIFDALLRETHEETGLEVEVSRFLAAAAYLTRPEQERPAFYTFAFLLVEQGGALGVLDEHERVEAFRELAPQDLLPLADFLEHLGEGYDEQIDGSWRDWGRFRAVIHRLVARALGV